ncbi:hypothetical protein [Paenibacillus spiritus]|nr:hypothetical protein [Paenibacillus spiritus]
MSANKRKPPTLQQKKEEVNRGAILWISLTLAAIVIAVGVLLIVTGS